MKFKSHSSKSISVAFQVSVYCCCQHGKYFSPTLKLLLFCDSILLISPAPHTCSTSCWINCHNGSRNGHLFPAPLTTQTANLLVLRCNQTSACRVLQMQCSSSSTAEKLTKLSRHVLTNLADGYFDGYFDSHSVAKQRLCCASVAHHATAVGLLLVGPKGLPVLQLHRAVEPTPSPGESDTGNRSDVPMENHETYGGFSGEKMFP